MGLLGDVGAEELPLLIPFAAGISALAFLPFGLLIVLAEGTSAVGRWLCFAVCLVPQALVSYEIFRPDQRDGQAGLIFLVLPFYLAALVFAVWLVDQIVRAVARRASR